MLYISVTKCSSSYIDFNAVHFYLSGKSRIKLPIQSLALYVFILSLANNTYLKKSEEWEHMNIYLACKTLAKLLFFVGGLLLSSGASAGLINGDFSDGLYGWSGDINYYSVDADEEIAAYDINFTEYTDNYFTGSNSVTLNTSANSAMEYWGVYLFQAFMVADNSSLISLAFDSLADSAYVTLVDDNGDLLHDFMLDGLSADISALAGSSVALEFGIEDFNYNYDDYLTVSNISISQSANAVSAPNAFALFLLGLLAVRLTSVSGKKAF